MSQEHNASNAEAEQSLQMLCKQKALLEEQIDEHTRWLNEVAAFCSSEEEQQRIVADIYELRQSKAQVEKAIAGHVRAQASN